MSPTMMFSMERWWLEFLAEADVESAEREEGNGEGEQISHGSTSLVVGEKDTAGQGTFELRAVSGALRSC